jgi:nitrile hydratase
VNGIHDMGGMHGFGPVVVDPDEPVFHRRWEGRVRGIFQQTVGRHYNLDEFRRVVELMEPAAYLEASYYERWLYAIETLLAEKGVTAAVADREDPSADAEDGPSVPASPGHLPTSWGGKTQPREQVGRARFAVGDRVRARNLHPSGHTRLPRYVRGKGGVVTAVVGPFRLPDANAHGRHDVWEFVYPVRFAAADLWGEGDHSVSVDLWESYLEVNP